MEMITGFVSMINSVSASEFIIIELAIILIIAALFSFFARIFKQPLLLAYVLTGFIVGPAVLGFIKDMDFIRAFSEIGISFLLFFAGLEISLKKLKEANPKKIVIIGLLQVLIVFILTFSLKFFTDFSNMQVAFFGFILAFSSTMVVIKVLAEKKELVTMHGRIVLGILLLQDLIAVFCLIFLSSEPSLNSIFIALGKLFLIVLLAFISQKIFSRRYFSLISEHPEFLLVSALALLFFFASLSLVLGMSIAIGAFFAGFALANTPFRTELQSRISPLRDFFSVLFFVALGTQLVFDKIIPSLFFFLLIGALVLKPIVTMLLVRTLGYKGRTSVITGISLGQLSEFSLILCLIGVKLGVLNESIMSTVVLVTIITMSVTLFNISFKERISKLIMNLFKSVKFIEVSESLGYSDKEKKDFLLIGCHRIGSLILRDNLENKKSLMVMDYDPEIISALRSKKISCLYGDIRSPDIFDSVNFLHLKKIVCTVPDFDGNLFILEKIKKKYPNIITILTASHIDEALELYQKGADYVMLPHFTAGEVVANIIKKDSEALVNIKKNQIDRMKKAHNILY